MALRMLTGSRLTQLGLLALLATACGGNDDADTVAENACLQYGTTGAVYDPGTPGVGGAPEIPTGFAAKQTAFSRSYMVVAANPLATKAGCEVLKKGGSAIDAAIATQMVLNIVEPQSSGIGGGAFMLSYDRKTGNVTAYDGRETAPAAATTTATRSPKMPACSTAPPVQSTTRARRAWAVHPKSRPVLPPSRPPFRAATWLSPPTRWRPRPAARC